MTLTALKIRNKNTDCTFQTTCRVNELYNLILKETKDKELANKCYAWVKYETARHRLSVKFSTSEYNVKCQVFDSYTKYIDEDLDAVDYRFSDINEILRGISHARLWAASVRYRYKNESCSDWYLVVKFQRETGLIFRAYYESPNGDSEAVDITISKVNGKKLFDTGRFEVHSSGRVQLPRELAKAVVYISDKAVYMEE